MSAAPLARRVRIGCALRHAVRAIVHGPRPAAAVPIEPAAPAVSFRALRRRERREQEQRSAAAASETDGSGS